jgi:hypothetical protein
MVLGVRTKKEVDHVSTLEIVFSLSTSQGGKEFEKSRTVKETGKTPFLFCVIVVDGDLFST